MYLDIYNPRLTNLPSPLGFFILPIVGVRVVYASAAYCFPKFVSRRYNGRFYCVYGVRVGNGKYNDGQFPLQ